MRLLPNTILTAISSEKRIRQRTHLIMKNWSTDTRKLALKPDMLTIWKLEQMVNFGLDNEKLKGLELKKYWGKLQIDPDKKKYLARLLHD